MSLIRRLILTLVLFPAFLFGQSSVWKVSKGDKSLYLGGTCHILRKSDFPLPAEFDKAYEKADSLIFEVDPSALQDPSFAMQLMSESVYKDGRTLKTVLSEEAYTALAEQGRKSNLPIEVIERTKPGMAITMITLQELTKIGVSQEGVDLHYAKKAQSDKKSIGSLETADFQLDLLVNLGEGMESEMVLYSLKDLDKIGELFEDIIASWRSGNLDTIEEVFVGEMSNYPDIYNQMIKDRNARWIPQIEAMLSSEPTEFVLVGVGHMPGKDGLLPLLKAAGCSIEQVK